MNMLMMKYMTVVLFFYLTCEKLIGQPVIEAGLGTGIMQYQGDLGGYSDRFPDFLLNKTSRPSISGAISINFSPNHVLSIRLQSTFGRVQAADSLLYSITSAPLIKKTRNLHFRSPVSEASLLFLTYPLAIFSSNQPNQFKLSPFLMIGGGLFAFNPKGFYRSASGEKGWIDLKPLRTEGQGMIPYPDVRSYELIAFNLQAGGGVHYQLTEKVRIGIEIFFRKTSTDYLDDAGGKFIDNSAFDQFFGAGTTMADQAKQMSNSSAYFNGGAYIPGFQPGNLRGSPAAKDYYYTSMLSLQFRINKENRMRLLNGRAMQSTNCTKF
jgi:hypothetical protein